MPLYFQIGIYLVFLAVVAVGYRLGIRDIDRYINREQEKRLARRYLLAMGTIFVVAASARAIEQINGSIVLDGLVGVFLGIFISMFGLPILYSAVSRPIRKIKIALLLVIGLLPLIIGILLAWSGLQRLVSGQM